MWDVIIVGGGPGGAIAAKRCAEGDLKTLLLEKKGLPREKVCTGMVMSSMAQNIIRQEIGEIPAEVLTTPSRLSGICLHLIGTGEHRMKISMPLTWRRDLDHWLIQAARGAGAQVWEKARVIDIAESPQEYRVKLTREKEEMEVKGRFIIGADGAASVVRKSLFPELKPRYVVGYRKCYRLDLGLEKDHWHVFFTPETMPYYFSLIHKGEFLLIDLGARAKDLEKSANRAREILARTCGFNPESPPLWRDACLEPVLYHELLSGSFLPAKRNGLLVGDAAGLILPVSGEGIGATLQSGLWAALSVIEANKHPRKADDLYLARLRELLSRLQQLYRCIKEIVGQKDEGSRFSLLRKGWEQALSLT